MELTLTTRPSPIGTMLIVTDAQGALRALDFEDYDARMHELLRLHYGRFTLSPGEAPDAVITPLNAYFQGDLLSLHAIRTATGGTPFQREVWRALMDIPAGRTQSYGEMAQRLGRPGASRAVGLANGANPLSLVVPCHRVVGSKGALTGYGGGLWRKQWLLAHEQAPAQDSLFAAA